jgi:hypothetical protein
LQSNDPRSKVKAEVHQDSGKFSIKFTVSKTTPEFKMGAKKINLNWAPSFVKFKSILQGQSRLPGSRISTRTFQS